MWNIWCTFVKAALTAKNMLGFLTQESQNYFSRQTALTKVMSTYPQLILVLKRNSLKSHIAKQLMYSVSVIDVDGHHLIGSTNRDVSIKITQRIYHHINYTDNYITELFLTIIPLQILLATSNHIYHWRLYHHSSPILVTTIPTHMNRDMWFPTYVAFWQV